MYGPESMDDGGASAMRYAQDAKSQTETWVNQLGSRIDDLERKVADLQRSIDTLVAGMQRR
jgi:uncharacterized protein YceH (UPF0502 family)